jgi:TolB-like protein
MAGSDLQPDSRMIATRFADINNVSSPTTFGRMAAQQIVSRFTQEGFSFVELQLHNNLYQDTQQGELILSRELNDVSSAHNAPIVLVGSYAATESHVFVNARLIRMTDNLIIASYDYAVPYTRDMRELLRPQR